MTSSDAISNAEAFAAARLGDKLHGRVALVTGGTRGIGAAISSSLASQGATVAAGFSRNLQRAEEFKAQFSARFRTPVTVHRGNVASGDDCRRVVAEVIDQHGRLDILVNNAGITIDKTILKLTDDDWEKVLSVNLSGAFYLSQAALRHMVMDSSSSASDGVAVANRRPTGQRFRRSRKNRTISVVAEGPVGSV